MKQDIVWYDLTLLRSDVMNTLPSNQNTNINIIHKLFFNSKSEL
jgi:hypothetical protein